MKDDPTLDAVRDARRAISEAVGHDVRKLVERYRRLQGRHRDRLLLERKGAPAQGSDDAASPLCRDGPTDQGRPSA